MAILKWKKIDQWYTVYGSILKDTLRCSKNLSDLTDKNLARTNLELVGDNITTHLHDSRYLPLIQAETSARTIAINNLSLNLSKEVTDRQTDMTALESSIDTKLTAQTTSVNKSISDLQTSVNLSITNLTTYVDTSIANMNTNLTNNINSINTVSVSGTQVNTSVDLKVGSYYLYANGGIGAGTYGLKDLLQRLVNLSHNHSSSPHNCNCNCNCGGNDGN